MTKMCSCTIDVLDENCLHHNKMFEIAYKHSQLGEKLFEELRNELE